MESRKILGSLLEAVSFDRTMMSDASAKKNISSMYNALTWSPEVELISRVPLDEAKLIVKKHCGDKFEIVEDGSITVDDSDTIKESKKAVDLYNNHLISLNQFVRDCKEEIFQYLKENIDRIRNSDVRRLVEYSEASSLYAAKLVILINELEGTLEWSNIIILILEATKDSELEYVTHLKHGMELRPTHKLNYRSIDNELDALYKALSQLRPEYNDSTGGHIHIGVNYNFEFGICDVLRLIFNYNANLSYFEELYGRDIYDNFYIDNKITLFPDELIYAIENNDRHVSLDFMESHYGVVNVNKLNNGRYDTVEFRGASGNIFESPNKLKKYVNACASLVVNSWTGSNTVYYKNYQLIHTKTNTHVHTINVLKDGKYLTKIELQLELGHQGETSASFDFHRINENDNRHIMEKIRLLNRLKKEYKKADNDIDRDFLEESIDEVMKQIKDKKNEVNIHRRRYLREVKSSQGRPSRK